jgi:peptidoglycan-N-acetylmuramic acid deacetylase
MKRKGLIVFVVACLDIVLIALAVSFHFNSKVCFFVAAHNEATPYSWYFMPRSDGLQPRDLPEFSFIKGYDAFWVGDSEEKVIYLTFDAGYENGFTAQILDVLKKHEAPAAFFLVGHYMKSSPELVTRMVSEGHLVCSHSMNHKDMAAMSDINAFTAEMQDLEKTYTELTGKQLPKYFRPPEGRFSERSLKYAEQLGYKTIFWSFAYVDWYVDDQPSEEEAIKIMGARIHPGAIVLLHATSQTNAKVLDRAITQWKTMGYTLKSLDEFPFEKMKENSGGSKE